MFRPTQTARRAALAAVVALPLALVASGCSDDPSDDSPDTGADTSTDVGADTLGDAGTDTATAGYPEGPYGVSEGDVIENLTFGALDGGSLSFADLRDQGHKLLFLNTASGWCTACREEQPSVQALYEQLSADGFVVLVTVFEDNEYAAATAEFASSWRDQYSLTFPVVVDAEFLMQAYYDASATPMNMIVDLETMEILYISTGEDLDTIESIASATLGG